MTTPFRPLRSAGYALLAGLFLLPAVNAEAGFNVQGGDTVTLNTSFTGQFGSNVNFNFGGGLGSGRGGEFRLNSGGNSFVVFCIETTEHLDANGSPYFVSDTSDTVIWGGQTVGGSTVATLSNQAKWVYEQYTIGNFGAKSNALANAVQAHIWHAQGLFATNTTVTPSPEYDDIQAAIIGQDGNFTIFNDIFAVNLWDNTNNQFVNAVDGWHGSSFDFANNDFGTYITDADNADLRDAVKGFARQSQIAMRFAEAPVVIPEPSTIAVWSLAMFGLVVAGRRRLRARVA